MQKNETIRISDSSLLLKENRNAMDGIISTRFENNLTIVISTFLANVFSHAQEVYETVEG